MRRRRRPTLHHAVKDKRVTVLGPVKQPEMDFMSHRGVCVGIILVGWVLAFSHSRSGSRHLVHADATSEPVDTCHNTLLQLIAPLPPDVCSFAAAVINFQPNELGGCLA